PERRPDASRQFAERTAQRERRRRDQAGDGLREAESRQVARGALDRRDDAVALLAAPLHQLAAPAHVAHARQMAGDDHADAAPRRLPDFRQADAGGEAVEVEDVRTLLVQESIE